MLKELFDLTAWTDHTSPPAKPKQLPNQRLTTS
jgi:hypothetical protein